MKNEEGSTLGIEPSPFPRSSVYCKKKMFGNKVVYKCFFFCEIFVMEIISIIKLCEIQLEFTCGFVAHNY